MILKNVITVHHSGCLSEKESCNAEMCTESSAQTPNDQVAGALFVGIKGKTFGT